MYGEAVIVFNQSLFTNDGDPLKYRHKQVMQLASKQRFIAVQFLALLKNDLWKKSTEHSNAMARLLKTRLEPFAEYIRFTKPVETNGLFFEIPRHWYEPLSTVFPFYMWKIKTSEVRLMCSFDTTENDIDLFVNKIRELIQQ